MDRASLRRHEALFSAAFFASAAAACLLAALAPGSIVVRLVKLVPLALLCAARLRARRGRLAGLVGLGLFVSLLADALIDSVFVAGLGAFLVAHLFYLAGMGLPKRAAGAGLPMLPALVFGGFMWWVLVGSGRAPEALHAPITAYAIVISSMLGRAIGRAFVEPKDHASRVLCAGALFFVVSDALIGVNRWVYPVPLGRVWILATYYVGQYLIFRGSTPPQREAEEGTPRLPFRARVQ
ncbi:lysoplasmalogenase [Polyangium sorediatum]|uniref:Lysoplasmalogenase n=1 Tax=Polyangium sorediatum TaxID=889274 RepID=A0ABT6P6Z4_9BACT|nr:lysoplasmalogenase [Polyangium sorediatum]MDI1436380.1 lysoplasmalogenase [Polyangium sorediatum]